LLEAPSWLGRYDRAGHRRVHPSEQRQRRVELLLADGVVVALPLAARGSDDYLSEVAPQGIDEDVGPVEPAGRLPAQCREAAGGRGSACGHSAGWGSLRGPWGRGVGIPSRLAARVPAAVRLGRPPPSLVRFSIRLGAGMRRVWEGLLLPYVLQRDAHVAPEGG